MQTIEWLGMRLIVPDDWEIVRHAVDVSAGSILMIDRRRQRLQWSWTACAKPPDEKTIFDDFKNRDRVELPECVLTDLYKCGQFSVYRRTSDNIEITRAGTFDKRLKMWIDIVIPWPDGYQSDSERRILESYRGARSDAHGIRWCAFKLDYISPKGWKLTEAEIKPGRAAMYFEKDHNRAMVARIGAVDAWFDGHLENFLLKQVTDATGTCKVGLKGNHESCLFSGWERRFSFRWLVGLRRKRLDSVWHCPESQAMYHVMTSGYENTLVHPDTFPVQCCKSGSKGMENTHETP